MLSTQLKKYLFLIVIFSLFAPLAYSAGDNGAGANVRTPIGTRAAAMGNSFVALADDASAFYHNPAGITGLHWAYLSFNFQYLHTERYLGHLSFVHPAMNDSTWAFGVAATYLTYPGVNTYDTSGNYTGKASNRSNQVYLTVGKVFGANETFRMGLNVKLLNENLDDVNSYGAGFDLGTKVSISWFDIGLMVQDIVTAEKYSNRDTPVYFDRVLKMGLATTFSDNWRISFQVDKNLSTSNNAIFRVGGYFKLWQAKGDIDYSLDKLDKFEKKDFDKLLETEKVYKDELYLNMGYGDGTIGVGVTLKMWGLKFDLAASFAEFYLNKSNFLFTLDIPLY